jgi:hypothetical protein
MTDSGPQTRKEPHIAAGTVDEEGLPFSGLVESSYGNMIYSDAISFISLQKQRRILANYLKPESILTPSPHPNNPQIS